MNELIIVADLIELLKEFPMDATLAVRVAESGYHEDIGWLTHLVHRADDNILYLTANI